MKIKVTTEREVRSRFDARLGQHVKTEREICGVKQKDMAKALGISQSAYSRIEKGESAMTALQLAKIASVFDVSIGYLIGDASREVWK